MRKCRGFTKHSTCPLAIIVSLVASFVHAAPPAYDHVVIVIEENHALTQVVGNTVDAPYINNVLVQGGASFTNMYGITHPSQPNYLQLFSGSNQGITSNNDTSGVAPFGTSNLGAALIAAGKTFTGYSENLPSVGYTGFDADGGLYARRHNPWVQWQANSPTANQLLPAVNQPFSAFPTSTAGFATLPKVSIVVPNNANNMHDGTIAQGDTWLQNNVGAYANWAKTNNSLLVVVYDEDNSSLKNRIPTIFYGANVQPGKSVASTYTLHNLLRTVEDMYGTAHSGAAANSISIVGPFTSDPTVTRSTFQQGVGGYAGTHDTMVDSATPTTVYGATVLIGVDTAPSTAQALVRFDGIVGTSGVQIPAGSIVLSAKLIFSTGNLALNDVSLHRLNVAFTESSTYEGLVGGIDLLTEANASPEFTLFPNILADNAIFDVTNSLQSIVNGETNFGWLLRTAGADGWDFDSSEATTIANRPMLEVTFQAIPEPGVWVFAVASLLLPFGRGILMKSSQSRLVGLRAEE